MCEAGACGMDFDVDLLILISLALLFVRTIALSIICTFRAEVLVAEQETTCPTILDATSSRELETRCVARGRRAHGHGGTVVLRRPDGRPWQNSAHRVMVTQKLLVVVSSQEALPCIKRTLSEEFA